MFFDTGHRQHNPTIIGHFLWNWWNFFVKLSTKYGIIDKKCGNLQWIVHKLTPKTTLIHINTIWLKLMKKCLKFWRNKTLGKVLTFLNFPAFIYQNLNSLNISKHCCEYVNHCVNTLLNANIVVTHKETRMTTFIKTKFKKSDN